MTGSDVEPVLAAALADRYRLERPLGAGGMASVYLARDLRHDRDVAVKVIHPDLGAALGGERFLAEIRTTARLQHPHILPLLDSGDAGHGLLYYVMPFVAGETLRARLERERQLPIEAALRISREVAGALDYAHRQGIVHRDIKPENILLHDGSALVADFGIALAVQQAGDRRMTQTGLSLGTPQYMAPEQAMGEKTVDARADVYALGAVTYEMLAGDPPFTGSTVQAIVARVLSERPTPLTTLRDTVPAAVEQAVLTALAKLPADRFATAAEFATALAAPGSMAGPASAPSRGSGRGARLGVGLAMAAAGMAVGAVLAWLTVRPGDQARDLGFPPTAPMNQGDWYRNFSVAPDGSFIIYEALIGTRSQLWIREPFGSGARPIAGTEGAFGTPKISPDGKRVAFVVAGERKVVSLETGGVTSLVRESNPTGGGWSDDGATLFFGGLDGRKARWVDVGSGQVRELTVAPCMLPRLIGADRLLCGGGAERFASIRRLSAPETRVPWRRAGNGGGTAVVRGSDFRLVDDAYLIYASLDGTLMGARVVDPDSLLVGPSVPLVPAVRRATFSGAAQYDLTQDGTLVYAPGSNPDVARLVRIDRGGRTTPLPIEEAMHLRFTPSPDGTRLASVVEGVEEQELRIYDLRTGVGEVVARAFFIGPVAWSPDGQRLAYRRMDDPDREMLVEHPLGGVGAPRVLVTLSPPMLLQVADWLALDQLLVGVGGGRADASALLVNPTTDPVRIDTLGINSLFLSISPDRRWLVRQPQGLPGVELQPWPARNRRWLIDPTGIEPRFVSPTEITYTYPNSNDSTRMVRIFRVTLDGGAADPVGKRELVAADPQFADTPGWSHVGLGGDELYARSPSENLGHYLRVLPGWTKEMKRRVDEAAGGR